MLFKSVAGVIGPRLPLPTSYFTGDFNEIYNSGLYAYNRFESSSVTNSPGANYGLVLSLVYGSIRVQLGFIAGAAPNMFFREDYGDGWRSWASII